MGGDRAALVDLGDVFESNHENRGSLAACRPQPQEPGTVPRPEGLRRIRRRLMVGPTPAQIGLDERQEVTVEHALDVPHLVIGA